MYGPTPWMLRGLQKVVIFTNQKTSDPNIDAGALQPLWPRQRERERCQTKGSKESKLHWTEKKNLRAMSEQSYIQDGTETPRRLVEFSAVQPPHPGIYTEKVQDAAPPRSASAKILACASGLRRASRQEIRRLRVADKYQYCIMILMALEPHS